MAIFRVKNKVIRRGRPICLLIFNVECAGAQRSKRVILLAGGSARCWGGKELYRDMILIMAKIIVSCENVGVEAVCNRTNQKIDM